MILVPAAGDGTRFRQAGYKTAKHELPLLGEPMVAQVVDNVRPLDPLGIAWVATQELVGKTKGAIDTILKSVVAIERAMGQKVGPQPLVIANCDQLVKLPVPIPLPGNGLVFTFKSSNKAHSYVVTDAKDRITKITEKPKYDPPSDRAVSGVYYFPVAEPFLKACRIVQGLEANGAEQYVSAALSFMVQDGYSLFAVDVPTAILGTPEDYQRFETAMQFAPQKVCGGGGCGCSSC